VEFFQFAGEMGSTVPTGRDCNSTRPAVNTMACMRTAAGQPFVSKVSDPFSFSFREIQAASQISGGAPPGARVLFATQDRENPCWTAP
jgi:hypothetical protein